MRDAVRGRVAILAKMNLDDGVPGGFWRDEAISVARWLEQDGSLDALELTAGSSLLNPMHLFKGEAPVRDFAAAMPQALHPRVRMGGKPFVREHPYNDGYLLDEAKQIRGAVGVPMVLLGGVTGQDVMDRAMSEGFAAMAWTLLREPALVHKIEHNKCMPAKPRKGSLCPPHTGFVYRREKDL